MIIHKLHELLITYVASHLWKQIEYIYEALLQKNNSIALLTYFQCRASSKLAYLSFESIPSLCRLEFIRISIPKIQGQSLRQLHLVCKSNENFPLD